LLDHVLQFVRDDLEVVLGELQRHVGHDCSRLKTLDHALRARAIRDCQRDAEDDAHVARRRNTRALLPGGPRLLQQADHFRTKQARLDVHGQFRGADG